LFLLSVLGSFFHGKDASQIVIQFVAGTNGFFP
jgi:hypothetical protein